MLTLFQDTKINNMINDHFKTSNFDRGSQVIGGENNSVQNYRYQLIEWGFLYRINISFVLIVELSLPPPEADVVNITLISL